MAQQVKDQVLLLLWLDSLLWCKFDSWPGNFHLWWVSTRAPRAPPPPGKKKSLEKVRRGLRTRS